jgi:hypothetical protein
MFRLNKKIKEEPIVPDKLTENIGYKIFVIIAALIISFQFYLGTYKSADDPQLNLVVSIVSFGTSLIAAIVGFFVAKRYWNSEVFGKSYLALALGFLMNALGELVYYILQQEGQVPSPSVADWLFLSFYPLAFYHLAKNISFFKPVIKKTTKIFIIFMPVIVTGVYAFLEYGQEQAADTTFFLGLAYNIGGTVILSGAILGAMVFRQGILGVAWLILALGIVLTTVADTWYSYLDIYNLYTDWHPVNLLWYAGYLVVAYALYRHKKVI